MASWPAAKDGRWPALRGLTAHFSGERSENDTSGMMSKTAEISSAAARRSSFQVLGVRVDAVQIPGVVDEIEQWISRRDRCHYIAVTGMHGVTEAQHDASFKKILNAADLVVPDGMPLVWISRLRGQPLRRRVYGPELMLTLMESTSAKKYRHFFFGGSAGLAENLVAALEAKVPGLVSVGAYSPPFRALTAEEDADVVAMINAAAPDIIWVGLSEVKQDCWMFEHRDKLNAAVLVGVGAAFDFHAGTKKQAPLWMRENGLEWLFRLLQEPKRLWRRYLVYGSQFCFYVLLEFAGLKKFD